MPITQSIDCAEQITTAGWETDVDATPTVSPGHVSLSLVGAPFDQVIGEYYVSERGNPRPGGPAVWESRLFSVSMTLNRDDGHAVNAGVKVADIFSLESWSVTGSPDTSGMPYRLGYYYPGTLPWTWTGFPDTNDVTITLVNNDNPGWFSNGPSLQAISASKTTPGGVGTTFTVSNFTVEFEMRRIDDEEEDSGYIDRRRPTGGRTRGGLSAVGGRLRSRRR